MVAYLWLMLEARGFLIVVGPMSAGKTTFMNTLRSTWDTVSSDLCSLNHLLVGVSILLKDAHIHELFFRDAYNDQNAGPPPFSFKWAGVNYKKHQPLRTLHSRTLSYEVSAAASRGLLLPWKERELSKVQSTSLWTRHRRTVSAFLEGQPLQPC